IPVVGVPSASAAGVADDRRARYHLYTLARRSGGWALTLSVRRHAAGGRFAADGAPRPLAP
ncbi:MAG: metallophosphoesterase, partial [Candidatus Rokubacteria bacterium]|nr:metallophosphoesterase [Candidatus Rokubacteria bacterium]